MRDVDQRMEGPSPWSFVCDDDHRYFAASMAWRTIAWGFPEIDGNAFTDADRRLLGDLERQLRAYLIGLGPHPEAPFGWSHLVAVPHAFTGAPRGLNVYLRGCIDATVNGIREGLYAIANMAGYLVVSVIAMNPEHLITWTFGSALAPGKTVIVDPRRFSLDPEFCETITVRAAAVAASKRSLSAKQQADVKRRVQAVPQALLRTNPHVIASLMDHLNSERR